MKRFTLLLLACCLTVALAAQDLYTIKVGTFRDVKADDFTTLKGKGFIYGAPGPDNTVDVYLGQYATQATATTTAANLAGNGFRNAQAMMLPTATGQQVTVIQIALQGGNRPIDWATMEKAGQLYVEAVDGTNKIVTGIYPDARTAANFLPAIRALGYTDAFVRSINNVRLIPITPFETGIKKPLIPIDLQGNKENTNVSLSPSPVPNTTAPGNATPPIYGSTTTPELKPYNPTSARSGPPAPNLPAIDGRTKRQSSAELQRVLKEKGYYSGAVDGLYGPGTTTAYESAWNEMPEIRKYRKLSEIVFEPSDNRDLVSAWPEVSTLLAIAEDVSAGMANDTRARQLVQQRDILFEAREPLQTVASSRVNNWAATIWTNLDQWATEDPLHAQIYGAFRLTYHQSQVRLEDHYMDRGLNANDARDLATAMLQNLIGAQLDRFL
jgi:hypothetical protein